MPLTEYGREVVLPAAATGWPVLTLTTAEADGLELLLAGALPVTGYMTEKEYAAVRSGGRLPDGSYVPRPVTLDRPAGSVPGIAVGGQVALHDGEGVPLAALPVTEVWSDPDDRFHLAGTPVPLRQASHGPFRSLRRAPADLRAVLSKTGAVLGVPLSESLDGPNLALVARLAQELTAQPLLLPLVGGDYLAAVERGRTALAAVAELPNRPLVVPLGLPPTSDVVEEQMAALVGAAYGATHVLVSDAAAAQAPPELPVVLVRGEPVAGAATPTSLAAHSMHSRGGVTVFFTGLSGSGKSTLARHLRDRLVEQHGVPVSLLDGDEVRQLLSSGLTFSRADRDLNIRRVGFVAAEISRHGGIAICAPIAPYAATREEVRRMVSAAGGELILVHVATPLEVCERRDRKGWYAKARAGLISEFTGISDPYEEPTDADVVVDTTGISPEDAIQPVMARLYELGITERVGPT